MTSRYVDTAVVKRDKHTDLHATSSNNSDLTEDSDEDVSPQLLLSEEEESTNETNSCSASESTSSSGTDSGDATDREEAEAENDNSSIISRLAVFLPQLQKANADLDKTHATRRIDDVNEEEETYIEMNLGLGVLTEQNKDEIDFSESDNDEIDDHFDTGLENGLQSEDVMAKLRGESSHASKKRKIEEIGIESP